MIVKLLTEHHLEFLSLKGGYRGSSKEFSCHGSIMINKATQIMDTGQQLGNFEHCIFIAKKSQFYFCNRSLY